MNLNVVTLSEKKFLIEYDIPIIYNGQEIENMRCKIKYQKYGNLWHLKGYGSIIRKLSQAMAIKMKYFTISMDNQPMNINNYSINQFIRSFKLEDSRANDQLKKQVRKLTIKKILK